MSGWQDFPFRVEVKKGETKFFCMCGLSQNAPFCDGHHKGTGIKSKPITFEKDGIVAICGCRASHHLPMCDGSHRTVVTLPPEEKKS